LADKDISTLQKDFGIKVTNPICTNSGKDAPPPDLTDLCVTTRDLNLLATAPQAGTLSAI